MLRLLVFRCRSVDPAYQVQCIHDEKTNRHGAYCRVVGGVIVPRYATRRIDPRIEQSVRQVGAYSALRRRF